MVCHGCYDAPCQLKLGTFEGIERGASAAKVYDGSRLAAVAPTRLGIDAHGMAAWRDRGFHAVLPEGRDATPEWSPLLRMLDLKRAHPLTPGADLSSTFDLGLDRKQTCSEAKGFDAYAKEHPDWGMPYGLPGLDAEQERLLKRWIEAGAPHAGERRLDAKTEKAIAQWEAFFNARSLKSQLMARYLYEHLFLASLYFEGSSEPPFFRLVRSKTAAPEPIDELTSRRPFDPPEVERFYYRLQLRDERPLEKTHLPYALSPARLERWRGWFLKPDYEVKALPSYEADVAANPFRAFHDLPASARYRFLLDEAEFTLMGFIKGPVCRGQVALDVIEDRFWIAFFDPDAPWMADETKFLETAKTHLDLPAESGSTAGPAIWFGVAKEHAKYVTQRNNFLVDKTAGGEKLTPRLIWDGDGTNANAALTVFRHFDSATVLKGFVGPAPKTAWVLDYPLLERIHYLLTAGFDVYGNVAHQLATRLYMDFLRMEGEGGFLMFVPPSRRKELVDAWYRGVSDKAKRHVRDVLQGFAPPPNIRYRTPEPEREFLSLLEARVAARSHAYDAAKAPESQRASIAKWAEAPGAVAALLPELSFLTVTAASGERTTYSALRESAHTNVAELFHEDQRRVEAEDRLTVVPGFIGAYPNALFEVTQAELPAFVEAALSLRAKADYEQLRKRFGVLRSSSDFWQHADALEQEHARRRGLSAGLFDLNRLVAY